MKLVIKAILLIMVLVITALLIWAKPIIETIGTRLADTQIKIEKVRFVPLTLSFKMKGISIPSEEIFFPKGTINLIPLRVTVKGIKARYPINIDEKNFSVRISRKIGWSIDARIKDYDLTKIAASYGVKKGKVNGTVQGAYKKNTLSLNGFIVLDGIVVEETQEIFGLTSEDIKSILKQKKGRIEMDFTFNGPPDKLDNWTYYQPGKKTLGLISIYLAKKLS